jgi:hypothetical protein
MKVTPTDVLKNTPVRTKETLVASTTFCQPYVASFRKTRGFNPHSNDQNNRLVLSVYSDDEKCRKIACRQDGSGHRCINTRRLQSKPCHPGGESGGVGGDHRPTRFLSARSRATRCAINPATYPPLKPASMFTTVTFEAQLFSIPSNAATPPKLAP